MQFYILDPDPQTSASMLPGYALKEVNLREGWQILSDIGHAVGVEFPLQNKRYSPWHALTRKFWQDEASFECFLQHLLACSMEFEERFQKANAWTNKIDGFMICQELKTDEIKSRLPRGPYEQNKRHLLEAKRDKLTQDEIARLEGE